MAMRGLAVLWIRLEKLDFSVTYSRNVRNARSIGGGPIRALADGVFQ
jgi:hypothetical protein